MKKWIVVPILLASFGCEDSGTRPRSLNVVGPSVVNASSVLLPSEFVVQPSFLEPRSIQGTGCTTRSPLLEPISLGFRGDGRSDLFLSGVQMQFFDRTGVLGGSMTLGRTDLVQRFGSIALPAFGTRFFPFEFPFNCGGLWTGTLTVVVSAGDSFGRVGRATLRVPVR